MHDGGFDPGPAFGLDGLGFGGKLFANKAFEQGNVLQVSVGLAFNPGTPRHALPSPSYRQKKRRAAERHVRRTIPVLPQKSSRSQQIEPAGGCFCFRSADNQPSLRLAEILWLFQR
jgi:hypothetical protein